MTSLVLSGGHVLTLNPRREEYPGGYVAVDGNRITEEWHGLPLADEFLEASGSLSGGVRRDR